MSQSSLRAHGLFAVLVMSFIAPAVAAGQGTPISIHGAVGTHLNIGGNNQAVSVGFTPHERIEILVNGERIHWPTEVTRFADGFSATRGGTTTFLSGEFRFIPLTLKRVSPYALVSAGRGISRPNVNEYFPEPVTNDAWLLFFFGGGVRVPVTSHLTAFGDMRFGFQGERDVIFGLLPVRGGLAWRF